MPAQDNGQQQGQQTTTTAAPGEGSGGKGSSQGGKGGGGGGGGGKPTGKMNNPQGGGGQKPGGGNPFMSGAQGYNPGGAFFDFQSRPIAGASPLLNMAGGMATGLGQAGQGGVNAGYGAMGQGLGSLGGAQNMLGQAAGAFQGLGQLPGQTQESMDLFRSMPGIAGTQVTGENVANDPAVKAANEKFMEVMAPMIKDSAGLAGIGKSGAMTNALSSQQAQTLLPLIQGSMQREERGIDRLLGGTGAAAQGLFGGGQQSANQQQAMAQGLAGIGGQQAGIGQAQAGIGQMLAGLGGQEQGMLMNAINGLSGLGGQFRGIEQEQLNAPYDEQMRLFSEGLNSIYGPFGMIPGMMGSSSSSSGGKK